MAKSLFDDLISGGANFDRYSDKNQEYENKLKVKSIENQIEEIASLEQTVLWAKRIIEFFDAQVASNESLLKSASNFKEFESLLKTAKDIIEKENQELQEKAKKEAELKFKKQAEYEQSCIEQAEGFDNEINYLYNQRSKGKIWCENLDNLILNIDNSNGDVKSRIENLVKIDVMKQVKETVKIAIEYDNQITMLEVFKQDKTWRDVVRKLRRTIVDEDKEKKFMQYMVKYDLLLDFVYTANDLDEAEEKEKKQKQEQECLQKEEEKQRKLEEKEKKIKEEQEKIELENKIKHDKELEERQQLLEQLTGSNFVCYINDDKLFLKKVKDKKLKELIIPDGIDVICEDALTICKNIKSIFIPKSVSDIESGALSHCQKLESIMVNGKNNNFSSTNNVLYDKEQKTLIFYAPQKKQTRFDCPNTLEEIGSRAFENNQYLELIYVNHTRIIGAYAFRNCKNLDTAKLLSTEKIYKGAFEKCKKLRYVEQYSTIEIQGDVFKGCKKFSRAYYNKYTHFQ